MIVTITFFNTDIEFRFKEWVRKGNERSANSFGGTGITGYYKKIKNTKYLFFWRTNSPVGDYVLLRLLLFILFRKHRRELKISRVGKERLAELFIGGFD